MFLVLEVSQVGFHNISYWVIIQDTTNIYDRSTTNIYDQRDQLFGMKAGLEILPTNLFICHIAPKHSSSAICLPVTWIDRGNPWLYLIAWAIFF